ncbi:hypothetical protein [Nocardia terpenica]|uniref:hypothetical protein n=1 Tax=Nocardia terpenica TaxID=455432 RepID=UPI00142E2E1A|nr:hypothetical protein [Nocardia terpenica]
MRCSRSIATSYTTTLAASVLIGALVAGSTAYAAPPAGSMRTEVPVDSLNPDPGVDISWVSLYSPLPADVGPHPPECDYIHYLRYRDKNGPRDSSNADAVVTAEPGLQGGAMSYDIKARQVVDKAAAQGKHVEFWTVDRRSDCLIDRTGLDAAAAARDYHVALDYYFNGKQIDRKTFAGTKDWWDIPGSPHGSASFLRNDRQEQEIRDWHQIQANAIPDPAVRAKKVFCGGHSYGGLLAGLYSAWDFDRDQASQVHDGAGYAQCAGFFADDSLATPDPAGLEKIPVLGNLTDMFAGLVYTYSRGIPGVTDGLSALYPYVDAMAVLTPQTYYMIEIIGMAAYFEPDKEADLLRLLPRTPNTELAMRIFLTRTYQQFVTNTPDVWSFRYTNAALLGSIMGRNSGPFSIIQVSMGSFDGCPVADKDFPLPNGVSAVHIPGIELLRQIPQFADVPDLGTLVGNLIGPGSRHVAPIDPTKLCGWRNYDQDPLPAADGTPYTSKAEQVTDIHEFARTMFEGPGNFLQMYVPYVQLPGNSWMANMHWWEYSNATHRQDVYHRPMLTTMGTTGLVKDALNAANPLDTVFRPTAPLVPTNTVYVPNRRHIDVVTAAPNQNDAAPEAGSRAMVEWVLHTAG